MRGYRAAFVGALAACISFSVPGLAQVGGQTDVIRGQVRDDSGTPVENARVEVRDLSTGHDRVTSTRAGGRYTVVFVDGSGSYGIEVSAPGLSGRTRVARYADEDFLVADVEVQSRTHMLDSVEVRAPQRRPAGRPEAGAHERSLSGDLVERLPLADSDPSRLAGLAPGVTVLAGDGWDAGGFSVGGQSTAQNQVTLDGATFAALLGTSALGGGMPAEALRATRVITSTFDVSRGQFAGGQVEMSSRGGGNTPRGSVTYTGRDDRLEAHASRSPWADGLHQHRLSGGGGGPIARDRLFYHLAFTVQQRGDRRFALEPRDPSGYSLAGIHADSVARFLRILQHRYGIELAGLAGGYRRGSRTASGLARLDYLAPRHSMSLRTYGGASRQTNAFLRPLDALDRGGEQSGGAAAGVASLTSQFGDAWINELRISFTSDSRQLVPNRQLPGARVRVASDREAGTRMVVLGFGSNALLPRSSQEQLLEIANEVSTFWGFGHRLKLGGFFARYRFSDQSTTNRLGTFTFESLDDLEAGRPSSFTRTISEGTASGSGWNYALYIGDSWRATPRLQLTYGARLEGSALREPAPAAPLVDALFGIRTDRLPRELHVSPRAGFSWRLNADRQPLRLLRGGIGEFRGRMPAILYADVLRRGSEIGGPSSLVCIGEGAVPLPDFRRFLEDPRSIPRECASTVPGSAAAGPLVAAFAPGFGAPRAWRASLGYQAQLWRLVGGSLDVTYTRGMGQPRIRDLNLREDPRFVLGREGSRPVFFDAADVDPDAGRVGITSSRVHPEFASVFEIRSDARSEAAQVTVAANGFLPALRMALQSSYTLSYGRDEAAFAFGGAAAGFAATPVQGHPNRLRWADSDMARRHSVVVVAGLPIGRSIELALVGRASSGVPFTPLVASDINGDGMANDAAFVFPAGDMENLSDTHSMDALLAVAPSNVRACLKRQSGRLAERNSCRTAWQQSFDLRAAVRPRIAAGRFTVAVDLFNAASVLDLLLHGPDGARGWGETGWWVDPVLLVPRTFDAVERAFRYEVNPGFGQARSHRTSEGLPFTVQVSGRMALGPRPAQDPTGGFADLGGPGMAMGTLARIAITSAAGGDAMPHAGSIDDLDEPGHGPGPGALIGRALPEPLTPLLALADSLGLSTDQRRRLGEIRDALVARNEPIRAEVTRVFVAAFRGDGAPVSPEVLFETIGPRLNEGRLNVQAALDEARDELTGEQWERVPAAIRDAVSTTAIRLTPPTP